MAGRALRRSRHNRMLAGVVGGMSEYLGIDPTMGRVIYVVVSLLSAAFPGILVYIICMFVIPEE